jgi:hypothetical protein
MSISFNLKSLYNLAPPEKTYWAGWMHFTLWKIVDEWDMVTRMPVQRVEDRIKLHRLKKFVYWFNNLQ